MGEQARIQGPIIATWVLAIIACILRFVARRISKAGFWYDDWLIVPALVVTLHGPIMFQWLNQILARCLRSLFYISWLE